MRNFVVVVLLLVAIGCGDGPSSPTAPTPQASLVQTGTPSLDCGVFLGCTLDASIQNIGAGCASGTAVVARLTDSETNEQVGPDIQMRAATGPLSNLPSLTIRPQESLRLLQLVRSVPTWLVGRYASNSSPRGTTSPVRSLTAARCASGSPRAAWSFLRRPLATPRDERNGWPSQRLLTVGPGRRVLSRKFGIGRRKAPAQPEFVLGVEPFEPLARATLSLRHFRISKLSLSSGLSLDDYADARCVEHGPRAYRSIPKMTKAAAAPPIAPISATCRRSSAALFLSSDAIAPRQPGRLSGPHR